MKRCYDGCGDGTGGGCAENGPQLRREQVKVEQVSRRAAEGGRMIPMAGSSDIEDFAFRGSEAEGGNDRAWTAARGVEQEQEQDYRRTAKGVNVAA